MNHTEMVAYDRVIEQNIRLIDERDALRALVSWMSPWIDDQVRYHGAVLTDAETDAYNKAQGWELNST